MLYMSGVLSGARGLFICCSLCLLWSCSNEPSVVSYREAKQPEANTPAPAANPASDAKPQQQISFTAPEGWQPGRPSSMRLASFSVPTGDESADVSLVRLAGMAGGLLANVNRWRGQIGLSPVAQTDLDNLLRESETEQGTSYFRLDLVNESTGQSILAGIYLRENYTLFAKLTASGQSAEAASDSFYAFCDSVVFP